MYKMEVQTTNNISKYESFILGIRVAKDLNIQQLTMFGDTELVVQQVKNVYQVKQHLLKVYRNEVWNSVDNFLLSFNIAYIPRDYNQTIYSLALASAYFKVSKLTHLKYPIEVRYRP